MRYKYKYLNAEMPDRQDVLRDMPNEAAREILTHLAEDGLETFVDRFEAQQPLCRFGLDGTCCRRCLWGPCRVTAGKRGVCGADLPLVVISNHIRMVAAGAAAHGQRARQSFDAILAISDGTMAGELRGEERLWWLADKLGLDREGQSLRTIARRVAEILLEDQARPFGGPPRLLTALAPRERFETWQKMDILPTSAYYEVFESLNRTTVGTDSDWRNVLKQELRLVLAYFWSSVVGAEMATEILYGPPRPRAAEVGYGMLGRKNTVKLALHGHVPLMAEAIVNAVERAEIQAEARAAGADGIELFGMCCTGEQLLARHGIPSTSGILGQEMVVGTGALDAVVADMACILPAIMPIAARYGTAVITTSESNRIEGAIHIPMDLARAEETALEILRQAITAFAARKGHRRLVPAATHEVMAGFDTGSILDAFGGRQGLVQHLREGKLRGIVTMVSCNTPKVVYEYNNVHLATELIKHNVLVTTTGCAGHALMHAGLAGPTAADRAGEGLRSLCRRAGIPPVLSVGECVDNTRTMLLFFALAEEAGVPIHQMPFFYIGAEPGNEKALGMAMSFFVHGINVLTGYPVPIPVPAVQPNAVAKYLGGEALETLGSRMVVQPDPHKAAAIIVEDLERKRAAL